MQYFWPIPESRNQTGILSPDDGKEAGSKTERTVRSEMEPN
jgi:hypothetical protein